MYETCVICCMPAYYQPAVYYRRCEFDGEVVESWGRYEDATRFDRETAARLAAGLKAPSNGYWAPSVM